MELPVYSEEQYNVIKCLETNNVVVDSVAGSGKTTCNLHIATYFADKSILLLTYNAKLKIETREKAKQLKLNNITVHNYHSFCVKNYDNKCFTDSNIIKLLKNKKAPLNSFNYDIIILDEAQDITPLYYELVCKIYKDNMKKQDFSSNVKICIMGDRYQSIYDFMNADERFITKAPLLFNFNTIKWSENTLSQSFRITNTMADFINNIMLKNNRIKSNKISSSKPRYIVCDTFGDNTAKKLRTLVEIEYYIKLGYRPDDIFILSPSVKNDKLPVRVLENHIKTYLKNIPLYVPTSDDEKLDLDILKNKMVFSTFHQAKGLERKVTIVFNFDNSYFKYFKKDVNPNICPNEMYVATTRAKEHLTLFHHYKDDYMPFLNRNNISKYCMMEYDKKLQISNNINKEKQYIDTSVTTMIKHLPCEILDKCFNILNIVNERKINTKINIPVKTDQIYGSESVSEITGTAIPSYFEYKIKNRMSILDCLHEVFDSSDGNRGDGSDGSDSNRIDGSDGNRSDSNHIKQYNLDNIIKKLNKKTLEVDELLYVSNIWCAYKSGFIFKTHQITSYDWLSIENLTKCIERLSSLNLSKECFFEYKVSLTDEKELLNRKLIGFIDCIDKNNMYEFKCVNELTKEHYLQLAIYMYMYEINMRQQLNSNKTQSSNVDIKVGCNIKYISRENMDLVMDGVVKSVYKNGNIDVVNIMNSVEKIRMEAIIIQKPITIPTMNYYLYNILTDELNSIKFELEPIKEIIKILIDYKYNRRHLTTDDEFIKCNNIKRALYL